MTVLHFDYCAKLRKAFADFRREAERQAERAARAAEETKYRESFNARHKPTEPQGAA